MSIMMFRGRSVVVPVGFVIAALAAGGCEDQASKSRAEIQVTIAEASRELHAATVVPALPGDDLFDSTRSRLRGVINTLAGAREGEAGQKAAASLLAATAHHRLAAMDLARAEAFEAQHRQVRVALHSQIDTAMRLEALAGGRELVTTDTQRQFLTEERTEAERQLAQYSEQLGELDGPISERETANEMDRQAASRLEDEATGLRRRATELGPADGLEHFQEAIRLERQADTHKLRVARRENDLQHDLRPEHNLASAHVQRNQILLGQIADTIDTLDRLDQLTTGQIDATRQLANAFRSRIDEALHDLAESAASDLEACYTDARGGLEAAAREARNATGGGTGRRGGNGPKMILARIFELQGQLQVTRARGLEDHLTILRRLIDAQGVLGSPQRAAAEAELLQSRLQEARQAAEEAFGNAKGELESIQSGEAAAFRRAIDMRLAVLGGGTADDVPAPPRAAPPASATPAAAGASGGLNSPEELVALMNAVAGDGPELTRNEQLLNATHMESDAGRQLIALQRQSLVVTRRFMAALRGKFGEAAYQQFKAGFGATLSASSFQNVTIENRSDDRVTVSYSSAAEPNGTMDLIRIDDQWFIDGDSAVAAEGEETIQQILAVLPAANAMLDEYAGKISNGEFASAQALFQAIGAEFMRLMGGAGGAPATP